MLSLYTWSIWIVVKPYMKFKGKIVKENWILPSETTLVKCIFGPATLGGSQD